MEARPKDPSAFAAPNNKYMLFTGWDVRIGRNCARDLEYRPRAVLRPRAQFLPIRTDLGRWITFLFFSYWDLKVSGKFSFNLQPMCVEVGCIRVDEARDWLQTKTKHYNMNFGLVIYNYYGTYCSLLE